MTGPQLARFQQRQARIEQAHRLRRLQRVQPHSKHRPKKDIDVKEVVSLCLLIIGAFTLLFL